MTKTRTGLVFGIFITMLFAMLAACGTDSENWPSQSTERLEMTEIASAPIEESENNEPDVISSNGVVKSSMPIERSEEIELDNSRTEPAEDDPTFSDSAQIDTSDLSSYFQLESADYGQFLKKIWIVDDWWVSKPCEYSFLFIITEIENNDIEGKYRIDIVSTSLLRYFQSYDAWSGSFNGTINNGVAECHFSDNNGNGGSLVLHLVEIDIIKATIEFSGKEERYRDSFDNEGYSFRPYNISDIAREESHFSDMNMHYEKFSEADLDSWGKVTVTSLIFGGCKPYPMALLTNEKDDILYMFGTYQVASDLTDVAVEDINGDGLKDVRFTIGLVDYDTGLIFQKVYELVYIQTEYSFFYIDYSLGQEFEFVPEVESAS